MAAVVFQNLKYIFASFSGFSSFCWIVSCWIDWPAVALTCPSPCVASVPFLRWHTVGYNMMWGCRFWSCVFIVLYLSFAWMGISFAGFGNFSSLTKKFCAFDRIFLFLSSSPDILSCTWSIYWWTFCMTYWVFHFHHYLELAEFVFFFSVEISLAFFLLWDAVVSIPPGFLLPISLFRKWRKAVRFNRSVRLTLCFPRMLSECWASPCTPFSFEPLWVGLLLLRVWGALWAYPRISTPLLTAWGSASPPCLSQPVSPCGFRLAHPLLFVRWGSMGLWVPKLFLTLRFGSCVLNHCQTPGTSQTDLHIPKFWLTLWHIPSTVLPWSSVLNT